MKLSPQPIDAALDSAIALAGITLVLVQVLYMAETQIQGTIILAGLFRAIIGVWRMAGRPAARRQQPMSQAGPDRSVLA